MGEFQLLIGDIGGTNARFAMLLGPDEAAISLPRQLTADHPDPVAAIRAALGGQDCPPLRAAMIAVAGLVEGPVVSLTNASWILNAQELGEGLSLSAVTVLNDYTPVAASLVTLGQRADDLVSIGSAQGDDGLRLVLGPGTGFGAAALVPVGERWRVLSTEAGHVDFGPANDNEAALWPHIERLGGRITPETVLSGPGLLRLYRALAHQGGAPELCQTPADVTRAALAGTEELATDTLELFARLLGRYAGDLAVLLGATGGVSIGGGIAPTMIDILQAGEFRAAFERKAPFEELMRRIPTFVITHPDPALEGLRVLASAPERFVYEAHHWAA
jgi:glucokinase